MEADRAERREAAIARGEESHGDGEDRPRRLRRAGCRHAKGTAPTRPADGRQRGRGGADGEGEHRRPGDRRVDVAPWALTGMAGSSGRPTRRSCPSCTSSSTNSKKGPNKKASKSRTSSKAATAPGGGGPSK